MGGPAAAPAFSRRRQLAGKSGWVSTPFLMLLRPEPDYRYRLD